MRERRVYGKGNRREKDLDLRVCQLQRLYSSEGKASREMPKMRQGWMARNSKKWNCVVRIGLVAWNGD